MEKTLGTELSRMLADETMIDNFMLVDDKLYDNIMMRGVVHARAGGALCRWCMQECWAGERSNLV
jgi:hypothetical protein